MTNATALRLPIRVLGLSLGSFFAVTFLLCIALGLIMPDGGIHKLWLQFIPGFEWLTWRSVLIGLLWTQIYAWYAAVMFGALFNFFAARLD